MKSLSLVVAACLAGLFSHAYGDALRPTQEPVDRLTWTDSSGKFFWKDRHEEKLAEIAANTTKKFDFVLVGDSITHNWEAGSGTSYFGGTRKLGKDVAADKFAGYRWLDLGIGGDGTSQVIWRMRGDLGGELAGFETKLIALMIGTNNRGDSAEDVALGIKTIIDTIRAAQPTAKILLNAILPRFPREDDPGYAENPQAMNDKNKATNALIKEYCDGENVIWFDWNSQLYKNGELNSALFYDREHPAEGGYTIWANALMPYIREAAGSGSMPGGRKFHIKAGATDWTAGASYEETVPPGADDIIVVREKSTVTLNASTDADSLALVNALRKICFENNNSRFEINVTGGDTKAVSISASAYGFTDKKLPGSLDYTGGPIAKTGDGTLILNSAGGNSSATEGVYDYYSTIRVEGGTLKLQPNFGDATKKNALYGRIYVAEGATLYLPYIDNVNAIAKVMNLSGGGTVTAENVSKPTYLYFEGLTSRGDDGDFSGKLTGTFLLGVKNGADAQTLSGVNSDRTGGFDFAGNPTIRLADIGSPKTATSSLGVPPDSISLPYNGMTLGYVGNGGTTSMGFVFEASATAGKPAIFDAGPNGGLTFTGLWQRRYTTTGGMNAVLAGDNATPCVLNNTISDNTESANVNGRRHTLYMRKEGSGTWRVNEVNRNVLASGWSIDEGTLQYTTMAKKGAVCALGVATNLTDGTAGVTDTNAEHRVDYAIRLGGPTTKGESKDTGRLEYLGTTSFFVEDREIAVMGAGGLRNNGTAATQFKNIYGIAQSGEMTLFLDGSSTADNMVAAVSDARPGQTTSGHLSLVKAGSGTWRLSGEQTFSGDLVVTGGTLVVSNPNRYRWFRWTITGLYNQGTYPDIAEFCLMDADRKLLTQALYDPATSAGTKVKEPLTVVSKNSESLAPGEASIESPRGSTPSLTGATRLFDNVGYSGGRYGPTALKVYSDKPETAFCLTMRLRDSDAEVAGLDYSNGTGSTKPEAIGTCVSNYTVSASLDGISWKVIDEVEGAPLARKYVAWTYDTKWDSDNGGFYRTQHDVMHPLTLPTVDATAMLKNVRSVRVGNGATLKMASGSAPVTLNKLSVDASSVAGTIDGFAFASSGTLDIVNAAKASEVDLFNLANAVGAENLANWNFTFNGKTSSGRKLVYENGKLKVVSSGLVILLD